MDQGKLELQAMANMLQEGLDLTQPAPLSDLPKIITALTRTAFAAGIDKAAQIATEEASNGATAEEIAKHLQELVRLQADDAGD